MNPIEANQDIENRLRSYIRYSLPIERASPDFTPKLDAFFDEYRMVLDPYLELVPQYETGRSLREMADANVIHEETARIFAKAFGQDDASKVRLYSHQDNALEAVCRRDENLIVCSGTGSGKTECFLIPLVDQLVRQWEAEGRPERLSPGVRALILYPMNALVNDQVRRLRRILREAPFITFGQYVGETAKESKLPEDFIANLPGYEREMLDSRNDEGWDGKSGFDDNAPLQNEHRVRERWNEPANILVTNYSMLERILLAPATSIIFDKKWKYIILDEAHCYTGAVGTEIAWLVRRIKRRLEANGCPVAQLRYLATSATLISDSNLTEEQKADQIRDEFATKLFPAGDHPFNVLFGELKKRPEAPEQFLFTAQQYSQLAGDDEEGSLFQRTIEFEARAAWTERLKRLVESLPVGASVNAGITIHVLEQVYAALSCAHEFANIELEPCPFGSETAPTIRTLLSLVRSRFDSADERPKSKKPWNRQGESLESMLPVDSAKAILREWHHFEDQSVSIVSFEAFKHLLRISSVVLGDASEHRENDVMPQDLRVVLTEHAWTQLQQFSAAIEAEVAKAAAERRQLLAEWHSLVSLVSPGISGAPGFDRVEPLLADVLSQDGRVYLLAEHLEASLHDPNSAGESALSNVAKKIFANEPLAAQKAATEALIRLSGFAVPHGVRQPLLDLRYHQIARGLNPVAIAFSADEDTADVADFSLAEADTQQIVVGGQSGGAYGLGLCRDCGHPFALGYAEEQDLVDDADTRLVREESARFIHLHAFAWHRCSDAGSGADEDAQPRVWFNVLGHPMTKKCVEKPPGRGWVRAAHAVSPDKKNDPAFLPVCPVCGAKSSNNRRGAKFGKITPYELSRGQVQNVILDELSRLTDVSPEPVARSMPGKGRKILAFSDSRQGAAKLASQFEQFLDDVNTEAVVAFALTEAGKGHASPFTKALEEEHPVFGSYRAICNDDDYDLEDRERKLKKSWQRYSPDLKAAAIILLEKLKRHHAEIMLAAFRSEDMQGVRPIDAAEFLILRTLRERGRNSFFTKYQLRIGSKALEGLMSGVSASDEWAKLCKTCEVTPSELGKLFERVIPVLWREGALSPHDWLAERIDENPPPVMTVDWLKRCKEVGKHTTDFFIAMIPRTRKFAEVIQWALLEFRQTHAFADDLARCNPEALRQIVQTAFDDSLNGEEWRELLAKHAPDAPPLQASKDLRKRLRKDVLKQVGALIASIWRVLTAETGHAGRSLCFLQKVEDQIGHIMARSDLNLRLEQPAALEAAHPAERVEAARRSGANLEIVRIEEHTAQISTFTGSLHQAGFADGSVNILSCSTTFEMGVDLGELNCVFLANLPPEVANYRQRAGRAGRRPGASAYVLTVMSNTPHDRYYWQEPTKLMFGAMTPPVIYLDNQVMRARHLRAEALHHFLKWHEGLNDQELDWLLVGDCLLGERFIKGRIPVDRFDPICDSLYDWVHDNAQMRTFDSHVEGIDGAQMIDYRVGYDLAWQMIGRDSRVHPYSPGEVEVQEKCLTLGGPNQPEIVDGKFEESQSVRRRAVQKQIRAHWDLLQEDGKAQRRFVQAQTITWLTRLRVLPKYGFPVDVIQLLPDDSDPNGMNVSLERDLQIGLYEYAPGRIVFANKRVFTSKKVLAKELSKFSSAAPIERAMCDNPCCREPSWDGSDGTPCPICGDGALKMERLVQPEAFRAGVSKSARGSDSRTPEGTRIHVHTGFFKEGISVPDTRLSTQQSLSGVITLLNRGPNYQGFKQDGETFSLYHEVHTDIVAWTPDCDLFEKGGIFFDLKNKTFSASRKHQSRNRLTDSFRSALHAILRATARVLGVDPRGFDGLIHMAKNGTRSFVLFDTSSGGTGILLDLALTPGSPRNDQRARLIRQILEEAADLCQHCPTCEKNTAASQTPNTMPIPAVDYALLQPAEACDYRPQQACYDCLKSFSNQRYHDALDRLDAAAVIRQLLGR